MGSYVVVAAQLGSMIRTQANDITTEYCDGHELPGIQGHGGTNFALQRPPEWQKAFGERDRRSRRIAPIVEAAE
jgi:hypothetical protein